MAEIDQEGERLSVSTTSPGSLYTTVYTERKVKVYGVTEAEFDQLSLLNSGTLLFFSLGGAFFGVMAEGLFPLLVSASTEKATIAYTVLWGAASLGCIVIGGILWVMRRSLTAKIKAESTERLLSGRQ